MRDNTAKNKIDYEDYKYLIKFAAGKAYKACAKQCEFDDCLAEGNLIFVEAVGEYSEKKPMCAFSTFLYISLKHLPRRCRKQATGCGVFGATVFSRFENVENILETVDEDFSVRADEIITQAKQVLSPKAYEVVFYIVMREWELRREIGSDFRKLQCLEDLELSRREGDKYFDEIKDFWREYVAA